MIVCRYIQWRAEEEGVTHLLAQCKPRRYDPKEGGEKASNDAMNDQFAGLSSKAMSTFDPAPRKFGKVWTQGSGKGFFANTKWKEKLLCVGLAGICLFYDDKVRTCNHLPYLPHSSSNLSSPPTRCSRPLSMQEITDDNKPKNIIQLALCTVDPAPVKDASDGHSHGFEIVAPQRNFTFAVGSEAERDAWIDAIRAEIKVRPGLIQAIYLMWPLSNLPM